MKIWPWIHSIHYSQQILLCYLYLNNNRLLHPKPVLHRCNPILHWCNPIFAPWAQKTFAPSPNHFWESTIFGLSLPEFSDCNFKMSPFRAFLFLLLPGPFLEELANACKTQEVVSPKRSGGDQGGVGGLVAPYRAILR